MHVKRSNEINKKNQFTKDKKTCTPVLKKDLSMQETIRQGRKEQGHQESMRKERKAAKRQKN